MKKKIVISVVGCILILIAVVAILHFWFRSEGIQVLGDDIHAEISGKCFIIDPEKSEVLDETMVYVNGSTMRLDATLFEGELSVVGYQNTADGTMESTMGVEQRDGGYWLISHIQSCTHRENIDGITKDVEHICKYQYVYYLNPEFEDQVIVRIETVDDDPVYAVLAGSEEEALSRLDYFMEYRP